MSEPKPRLDKRTRAGLRHMASLVDAGCCDDFFGYSEEQMESYGRLREWEDVKRAAAWIWSLKP